MRPETRQAFWHILDTFSGTDGGIAFVKLQALVVEMDRQAANGDASAKEVVNIVLRFSRLITAATGQVK